MKIQKPAALAVSISLQPRLCKPEEFAARTAYIAANAHLNGEGIRRDGALHIALR